MTPWAGSFSFGERNFFAVPLVLILLPWMVSTFVVHVQVRVFV